MARITKMLTHFFWGQIIHEKLFLQKITMEGQIEKQLCNDEKSEGFKGKVFSVKAPLINISHMNNGSNDV